MRRVSEIGTCSDILLFPVFPKPSHVDLLHLSLVGEESLIDCIDAKWQTSPTVIQHPPVAWLRRCRS